MFFVPARCVEDVAPYRRRAYFVLINRKRMQLMQAASQKPAQIPLAPPRSFASLEDDTGGGRGQFAACGMTPVPTEHIRMHAQFRGAFMNPPYKTTLNAHIVPFWDKKIGLHHTLMQPCLYSSYAPQLPCVGLFPVWLLFSVPFTSTCSSTPPFAFSCLVSAGVGYAPPC